MGRIHSARFNHTITDTQPLNTQTPSNPQKPQGILNKPTLSGAYTLAVIYEGAQLYAHTGNVCGEEQVLLLVFVLMGSKVLFMYVCGSSVCM